MWVLITWKFHSNFFVHISNCVEIYSNNAKKFLEDMTVRGYSKYGTCVGKVDLLITFVLVHIMAWKCPSSFFVKIFNFVEIYRNNAKKNWKICTWGVFREKSTWVGKIDLLITVVLVNFMAWKSYSNLLFTIYNCFKNL